MGKVRLALALLSSPLLSSPLLGSPLLGSPIIIVITILIIKIYLNSDILFIRFIIFPVVRLIVILLFNPIYSISTVLNIIISVLNRRYIYIIIGSFRILSFLISEVLSVIFIPNINGSLISSLTIIIIIRKNY